MDEVLRGAFEQRAESLQKFVTSGVMTPNEARKLENLPALEGGDDLLVPLNLRRATDPTPVKNPPAAKNAARPDARAIAGRLGAVQDPSEIDLDRLTAGMSDADAAVTRHVVECAISDAKPIADVRRRLARLLQEDET